MTMHFNGKSFKEIGLNYDRSSEIEYTQMDYKNKIAVAVGIDGVNAAIMMLRR